MYEYNKFKERTPQETIHTIDQILGKMGLLPVVNWIDAEYDGALSNRVSIYPSSPGTNGKGTDQAYALASGYAELIERIQNGMLSLSRESPELQKEGGFVRSPDEVEVSAETVALQDDPFFQFLFRELQIERLEDKIAFLREPMWNINGKDDLIRCVPYVDMDRKRIIYLPLELLLNFYGSNGMAAGNTLEEALVQGLSEILERYANVEIIRGTVPPEVPREYIDCLEIGSLIRKIEESGRYRVSLRDCSLGKGIPATAVVIVDRERGCFGVHFSCHPSFEVSVERTLTEALQGKNLESFTSMNRIDSDKVCQHRENIANLTKMGYGSYPASFLAGKPDYPFESREGWQKLSNREMMFKLLNIIKNEGYSVLIRDVSHLGFPSYQVLVPGMSEIFPITEQHIREIRTIARARESMLHFPDLSEAEEKRLKTLILFKGESIMENNISWFSGIPFADEDVMTKKILILLLYKDGRYSDAMDGFRHLASTESGEEDRRFYACAAEYVRLRAGGMESGETEAVIRTYYPEEIVKKVDDLLKEPALALRKMFRPVRCYDCASCDYAGSACTYPTVEKIMRRIKKAMAESKVSQEELLSRLIP